MADYIKDIAGYHLHQAMFEDHLGILYLAEHQATEAPAWVKTFPPTPYTIDPGLQQTYLEGIRYLQSLRIPGFAQVFQAERLSNSTLYAAIDRAQGEPLQCFLDRGQGLSLASAFALMESLLQTLDHLHRSSVIHGDLRPACISIGFPGLMQQPTVRLLHFGQGWWWSENLRQIGGFSQESAFFMPPEQIQGRPFDHRADLYAAGMLLASLLFGSLPYGGDAAAFQRDRSSFLTRLMPELKRRLRHSVGLEDLLWRSLAPDPDERIATAHDFLRSLQQAFLSLEAMRDQDERLHQPMDRGFSAAADLDTGLDLDSLEQRDSTVVGPMPKRPFQRGGGDDDEDEFRPTQRLDLASSEIMGLMESFDSRSNQTSSPPPPVYPPPAATPGQSGPVFGGAAAIPSRDDMPMFTVRHEPPHPLTPPSFLKGSSPAPSTTAKPPAFSPSAASAASSLLGRDPLDVTLAGQRKRSDGEEYAAKKGSKKTWVYFAITLVVLAGAAFGVLQLLPSSTIAPSDVDSQNQVYVTLSLASEPPGAEIWLGSEKQPIATPADLKLRIGRSVVIQFRKEGFRPILFTWGATGNDRRSFRLDALPPAPPLPSQPPTLAQADPTQGTSPGVRSSPTEVRTPSQTPAPPPSRSGTTSGVEASKTPPSPKAPRRRPMSRKIARPAPSVPGGITLSLQSAPPGATVFVNEQQWPSPTPARITLRPGAEVKIVLQKYGHHDAYFIWRAEQSEQKNVRLSRYSWYNP